MTALTLNLGPLMTLTREGFVLLCAANPELKLERPAQRELGVVSPTSGEIGNLNVWNRQLGRGKALDFSLPSGSDRSPDLAWIPLEKGQRRAGDSCPCAPTFSCPPVPGSKSKPRCRSTWTTAAAWGGF